MAESLIYMGRHVSFELTEWTFGAWHWTNTIDEQASFESQGKALDRQQDSSMNRSACTMQWRCPDGALLSRLAFWPEPSALAGRL